MNILEMAGFVLSRTLSIYSDRQSVVLLITLQILMWHDRLMHSSECLVTLTLTFYVCVGLLTSTVLVQEVRSWMALVF